MKTIQTSLAPNLTFKNTLKAIWLIIFFPGWLFFRNGKTRQKLEKDFAEKMEFNFVRAVGSGREALYVLIKSLDIQPGSEVLVQGFTCMVVSNQIIWNGLTPVYTDIDEKSLSMSVQDLKLKISEKTKLLILQHSFGISGEIEEAIKIAKEKNIIVIEDCAHTIGGKHNGKFLGHFGDLAFFSLGRSKALSCVSGGIIAVNNKKFEEKIKTEFEKLPVEKFSTIFRNLFHLIITSPARFFYGKFKTGQVLMLLSQKLKLINMEVTANEKKAIKPKTAAHKLSDALSKIAIQQLQNLDKFNEHRKLLAQYFREKLEGNTEFKIPEFSEENRLVRLPIICEHRDKTAVKLKNKKILAGDWYNAVIAPKDADFAKAGYQENSLKNAESLSGKVLNLPLDHHISLKDAQRIVKALNGEKTVTFRGEIITIAENQSDFEMGLSKILIEERSFLQSYEYGQLQKELGNTAVYLNISKNNEIIWSYLWIIFRAKRGTFAFCPYGVFNEEKLRLCKDFFVTNRQKFKIDFLRVSANMKKSLENLEMFEREKFRNAPVHMMHPELDWVLDIDKSEKEILAGMRKNNRYGINKAEKDGVEVLAGDDQKMLDEFYVIHEETARRQGFVPWSKKFLNAQLKFFAAKNEIKIFLAKYEGKVIAGAVIMYYGDRGYYHHGASLAEYNKIPASYLIQWEAIKEAKKRQCKFYSFYGVVDDAPKHPWAGLSFFKKGFGGYGRMLLHCQDLPVTKKYWLNFLIEKIRRMKRGY